MSHLLSITTVRIYSGVRTADRLSYQKLTELHEVKHLTFVHLGQLLAQLDGLLPHLKRQRSSVDKNKDTQWQNPSGSQRGQGTIKHVIGFERSLETPLTYARIAVYHFHNAYFVS